MPVPLTWQDVMSLPAGPRRDELAYLWRTRDEARRRAMVRDEIDLDTLMDEAEECRRDALAAYSDTHAAQRRRRETVRCALRGMTE